MNRRATLSIALAAVAFGAGVVVAFGVGGEPSRGKNAEAAPAAPAGSFLRDVATPAELKLWNDRGCVTCHGVDARGSQMGPDVTKVVPLYVAAFGSAAKENLVEYLVDPQGSPKLRRDDAQYANPMPAIERLFGGKREDAAVLAEMLLRLAK